jgi:glycosyltransferase involved in cell wall biosynthesis
MVLPHRAEEQLNMGGAAEQADRMLVSIYLPTRNREGLLRRAVDSVLAQAYARFELIVVDDGSTDGTRTYLDAVRTMDPRVQVIRNETSIGAPLSRNRAIRVARGEFVTGLDDDDRFHPQRVAAFVAQWRLHEQIGERFSCLFSQDVTERGGERFASGRPGSVGWEDLFFCNVIGNQIFTRRETLIAAGLFDQEMPAWQDLDLFIRVLKHSGPAKLVDAGLYYMNMDPRPDRISVGSNARILRAYRTLAAKWQDSPRLMRQGLYLQTFTHYGIKPGPVDLLAFVRMGLHVRTLKTLAGIYLRGA